MSEQIEVSVEPSKQAESMTNEAMEDFFKQDQADEKGRPTNQQENDNETRSSVHDSEDASKSVEDSESAILDPESSLEDGREEHPDQQLQADERHERSYKVALKEERELRKQMQQELQEQRESAKKMSDAFTKMVDAAEKANSKSDAPPIPDYNDDPIGHLNAKLEQANKAIDRLSKTEQQIVQSSQEQQQMQRFMNDYKSQADTFARDQPDFGDAYKHLVSELQKDYIAQGMTAAEANERLTTDEINLAAQQMQNRQNPAKTLYELAKRRGYQSKSTQQVKTNTGLDKINRMEKGIKASRSINGMGESPNSRLTLEEISNLPDDEFEKQWANVLKMG